MCKSVRYHWPFLTFKISQVLFLFLFFFFLMKIAVCSSIVCQRESTPPKKKEKKKSYSVRIKSNHTLSFYMGCSYIFILLHAYINKVSKHTGEWTISLEGVGGKVIKTVPKEKDKIRSSKTGIAFTW